MGGNGSQGVQWPSCVISYELVGWLRVGTALAPVSCLQCVDAHLQWHCCGRSGRTDIRSTTAKSYTDARGGDSASPLKLGEAISGNLAGTSAKGVFDEDGSACLPYHVGRG